MTGVRFHCRDPWIEQYCQDRWGEDPPPGLERLLEREAVRQQWFDYTVDDDGKRQLRMDHEGNPALLIPSYTLMPAARPSRP